MDEASMILHSRDNTRLQRPAGPVALQPSRCAPPSLSASVMERISCSLPSLAAGTCGSSGKVNRSLQRLRTPSKSSGTRDNTIGLSAPGRRAGRLDSLGAGRTLRSLASPGLCSTEPFLERVNERVNKHPHRSKKMTRVPFRGPFPLSAFESIGGQR
jgi:hypothetical protein